MLDFFQDAYNAAVSGYTLTLSEENDDASYTEYDVIVNQPVSTPDTIGGDPTDRNLNIQVLES